MSDSSVNDTLSPEGVEVNAQNVEVTGVEDKVDYAKYRKLLDEKKKESAIVRELQSKLASIEENKLAESQRYKELFEKRDAELKQLQDSVEQSKKELVKKEKLSMFEKAVGGLKNEEYAKLVDLDKIIYSEEGICRKSLEEYANEFKAKYSDLISQKPAPAPLPSEAPKGGQVTLRNLSSKEILERMKNSHK